MFHKEEEEARNLSSSLVPAKDTSHEQRGSNFNNRGVLGSGLPQGSEVSRFGPHVRAAYLGPTQDNPFLTLTRRLKRARFLDERERRQAVADTQSRGDD